MNLKYSLGLAVLSLLLISTHSYNNYTFSFDTTYGYIPSFSLGYIDDNYTVMVNLTTTAGGLNAASLSSTTFVIKATSNLGTVATCVAYTGTGYAATATNVVFTCPIVASAIYILTVTVTNFPVDTSAATAVPNVLEYYQLTATSYLTAVAGPFNSTAVIKTLVTATDTLRDKVARLIYLNQTNFNVTIWPIVSTTTLKVILTPIQTTQNVNGSGYDFKGATPVALTVTAAATTTITTGVTSKVYSATAAAPTGFPYFTGYYLLVIDFTGSTATPFLQVIFQSETYTCPQSPSYPDYRGNFQPCTGTGTGTGSPSPVANVPGYPCTAFNAVSSVCSQCFTGYILSTSGTCLFNTTCPARQYYHYGVCYPVDASCGGFDLFTGACLNCTDALKYVVNGTCVPNPALIANCTSRQVNINNKCVDVSALCATFNSTTAGCLTCVTGYTLNTTSAACFPTVVVCGANQYKKQGVCVNFPPNCPNFDAKAQKCLSCAFGYYPNNGGCDKIICAEGKVPSKYGIFCIDVSPACNKAGQYDPLTGDCLKCKLDGYTVYNGICVQNVNPLSGCAGRQALGYGACVAAQTNCLSYNLIRGDCDQCNPGWFKDYTGVCNLQNNNANCRGD